MTSSRRVAGRAGPARRRAATRTRAEPPVGGPADRIRRRLGLPPGARLGPAAAAELLGTTPRMLRYREALGLLSPARPSGGRRRFSERDLLAAAFAVELERRYDVPPKALAFALSAIGDDTVAADVRQLGMLAGRGAPAPIEALDFDARKARELLRLPVSRSTGA